MLQVREAELMDAKAAAKCVPDHYGGWTSALEDLIRKSNYPSKCCMCGCCSNWRRKRWRQYH